VTPKGVAAILSQASRSGIDMLDTAISYGDSEASIGDAIVETNTTFDIVSKIPPDIRPAQLRGVVRDSLKRLRTNHIKAFLTHSFEHYKQEKIRNILQEIKSEGQIDQSGVSVYYPSQIRWLLDNNIEFDLVQLPFSIFDRRFESLFPTLKEKNVEIHVRSVFLQGLFFIDPRSLSQHFNGVKDNLIGLRRLSSAHKIPLSAILLNYALMQKEIGKVVIGVTNLTELKENMDAVNYLGKIILLSEKLNTFAIADEQILLPINWK
jgi:aryl-alcohol dehydrogenase-like predicted oxidoreductase